MLELFSSEMVSGICQKCRDGIRDDVTVVYVPMLLATTTVKDKRNKMEPLGGPDMGAQMFYLCGKCSVNIEGIVSGQVNLRSVSWFKSHEEEMNLPHMDDLEKLFKNAVSQAMMKQAGM